MIFWTFCTCWCTHCIGTCYDQMYLKPLPFLFYIRYLCPFDLRRIHNGRWSVGFLLHMCWSWFRSCCYGSDEIVPLAYGVAIWCGQWISSLCWHWYRTGPVPTTRMVYPTDCFSSKENQIPTHGMKASLWQQMTNFKILVIFLWTHNQILYFLTKHQFGYVNMCNKFFPKFRMKFVLNLRIIAKTHIARNYYGYLTFFCSIF